MHIVIDINENVYTRLFDNGTDFYDTDDILAMAKAIRKGLPLPKGHGNLCDENQIVGSLVWGEFLKDDVKCSDITKVLDMATIIEADKAESEDKG